ncbi:hypothetical protein SESBI_32969 [Sesbania bispinosa]|nr:hypothetical protein SESBI_32969 [Sesbania bispinosa]
MSTIDGARRSWGWWWRDHEPWWLATHEAGSCRGLYSGWTREGGGAIFGNAERDGATTGRRRCSGKAGAS